MGRFLNPIFAVGRLKHRAIPVYFLALTLIGFFFVELFPFVAQQLSIASKQVHLPVKGSAWLIFCTKALLVLLLVPLVISVVATTTAESHRTPPLSAFSLFRKLSPAYFRALKTIILVVQATLYILVAPVAMIAVYVHFIRGIPRQEIQLLYFALCGVICLVGYIRCLPFYLSPLVSALLEVPPIQAIDLSVQHFRKQSFEITILTLVGVGLFALGMYGIDLFNGSEQQKEYLRMALIVGAIWYVLSLISEALLEGYAALFEIELPLDAPPLNLSETDQGVGTALPSLNTSDHAHSTMPQRLDLPSRFSPQ